VTVRASGAGMYAEFVRDGFLDVAAGVPRCCSPLGGVLVRELDRDHDMDDDKDLFIGFFISPKNDPGPLVLRVVNPEEGVFESCGSADSLLSKPFTEYVNGNVKYEDPDADSGLVEVVEFLDSVSFVRRVGEASLLGVVVVVLFVRSRLGLS
jgi:hypothetical protein